MLSGCGDRAAQWEGARRDAKGRCDGRCKGEIRGEVITCCKEAKGPGKVGRIPSVIWRWVDQLQRWFSDKTAERCYSCNGC